MSRNLDKNVFIVKKPSIKQGLPVEKKTLLTAAFTSVLLLLAVAGTQLVSLARGNPFSQSVYSGERSPSVEVKSPEVSVLSPQNARVYNTGDVLLTLNVSTKESQTINVGEYHYISGIEIQEVYYAADWLKNETMIYRAPRIEDWVDNTPEYFFEETGRWYECYFFMGDWYAYYDLPKIDFEKLSLNLTNIPDGNHTMRVYAVGSGSEHEMFHWYDFYVTGFSKVNFVVDATSPKVSVLSLENKTYDTSDLPFSFSVNESVSQMAYSLDGQENVTITGNTTLSGLSFGAHNVMVYATDNAGNTGASETIHFNIAKPPEPQPKPFPATIVIAPMASATVVGVGLVVYFKKRKH